MARKPTYEELDRRIRDLEEECAKSKRADEALRDSRNMLQTVLDSIPAAVFWKDRDSIYLGGNRTWLEAAGLKSSEEVVGKSDYDLPWGREQGDSFRDDDRRVVESGVPQYGIIESYLRADGIWAWARTNKVPLRDTEGNVTGVLGTYEDITERVQAEEALRQSEGRYRRITEGLTDYFYTVRVQDGRAVETTHSPACEAVTGYTAEEFAADPYLWMRMIVAEDRDRVIEQVQGIYGGKESVGIEHRIMRKDGQIRWLNTTIISHADPQGKLLSYDGVVKDITERKRAEEGLRESEAFRSSLLEFSPIPILVFNPDTSIRYVNPEFERLTGYTSEELLGKKAPYPWWMERQGSGNISELKANIPKGVRGLERVFCKKNGDIFWVELTSKSIRDNDELRYNLTTWVDITEQKRAEEELGKSEARYRNLYEEAPVAYHEYDTEGCIISVNRRELEMLGYSAEEMLGQPVWNFVVQKEEAKESIKSKTLGLKPPDRGLERTFRRKDGTSVPVLIDSVVLRDSEGRITGIRSTLQDITERKRAEGEKEKLQARLNQAQKMELVGRLAGGVAHDFNNKLTIIIGNVEMAMLKVDPEEPIYHELDETLEAAHRSADLVRQLLAFARKQTVSPKVIDLNETVSGMLNMLRRLIGENIDLAWMPGLDIWLVKVDLSQIDQILANLAVNARDAMGGVGKMTIETANATFDEAYCADHPGSVPGQYVLLAVSDDGVGMSKDVLESLFEPFFTTKEVGKGTGLGLSSIYGIVKQNNGFTNVYSEPGQGTTVTIYLPRFETKAVEREVEDKQATLEGGTETVLMTEDEAPILKIGKAMLESLGYTVLTANTPHEAIRIAGEHSGAIHLLLTDVVMPEMNGRELAGQLKVIHPGLKLLYMSGYTADAIAHHGVLDEGVLFIHKPFPMKDLAAKVREALDKD